MMPALLRGRAPLVLLTLLACNESPVIPPDGPVGSLRITTTTTGAGAKPTLLQLLVDDDPPVLISANGTQEFEDVTVGELVARVVVPGHCSADHYAPRTVEIEEGEVTELSWAIRCPQPTPAGISSVRWTTDAYIPWIANADGSGGAPIGGAPGIPVNDEVGVLNPARTRFAYLGGPDLSPAIIDVDRGATVTTGHGRTLDLDWSPQGDQLLVVLANGPSANGGALVLMWADGVVERTIRPAGIRSARWAPDGRRIAYREGAYIYVEDLLTGARLNTQHVLVSSLGGEPTWSPDGTRLAFIDFHQETIFVMDADGGNLGVVATYSGFHGEVFQGSVDWGSDNLLLLLKQGAPGHFGTPHVAPAAGGDVVSLFDDGGSHYWARWAP